MHKKDTLLEKVVSIFLIFLLGVIAGYGWRMYYETKHTVKNIYIDSSSMCFKNKMETPFKTSEEKHKTIKEL